MPGWPELAPRLQALTAKADASEVIVVELNGQIVGAVGHVGPHQPKPDFFQADWPNVRLMSVAPQARGHGVGRAAQYLYRNEGFEVMRELPDMFGVPYVLMVRSLSD